MSTDERLAQALREALDERAARVEPGDRLEEILRLSEPARPGRLARWWMPLATADAFVASERGAPGRRRRRRRNARRGFQGVQEGQRQERG